MVYTGTYQRALDDKGRIALPKRLRDELGENPVLFATPGTDRCLELHTTESLNHLANKTSQSKVGSKDLKSFSRLFYAQAEQCDCDRTGRVRIPATLLQFAELTKEVVIIGVGPNWEIWDQARWTQYLTEQQSEFDRLNQATMDMAVEDVLRLPREQ